MFRFRSDLDDKVRRDLIDEYKSFPKIFPSMRNFSFGKNISERDNAFEYAFSVEFENESALKAYLSSKEHEEHVVERFRPAIQSRAIVSYEIQDRGSLLDIQRINWNIAPWTKVREGVERKGFSGKGATIALNRLLPGHEPRPHSHPHEQIVYIVSGKVRFHVGDAVYLLGAEELLVVPPNVEHWAEVIGDEPVLNLDVFSPSRPEYS